LFNFWALSMKKSLPIRISPATVLLGFYFLSIIHSGLAYGKSIEPSVAAPQEVTREIPTVPQVKSKADSSLVEVIELWLGRKRKDGGQGLRKGNLRLFDMRGLKFDELETHDLQYDKIGRYRGIHLRDLIAVMNPIPLAVDMIVLHTSSGMLIPVAVKDLTEDRGVFIATETLINGKWTNQFPPPIVKGSESVAFLGNKMVVGANYHNLFKDGFNPWALSASLVGVELVEAKAYYGIFNRKDGKDTSKGHVLYQGRCWSCHAVKGVGGGVGPDLTKSKILENKGKGIKEILTKVGESKKRKDQKNVHFMPHQRGFNRAEAKSIWIWLKDIQNGDLSPYQSSYEATVRWDEE
jgi:hypothetical protein